MGEFFYTKYVRHLCLTCTHAVWLHGDGVRDVRENTDGVSSVLQIDETISLKVQTVDVYLRPQS